MSDKRKSRQPPKKGIKLGPRGKNAPKKKVVEDNFDVTGYGILEKVEELKITKEEYITDSSDEEDDIEQPKDLPPFWKAYRHETGVLVYLHKPSRVCTLSKPFNTPPEFEVLQPGDILCSGVDCCVPNETMASASSAASSADVKKEDSLNVDETKKAE